MDAVLGGGAGFLKQLPELGSITTGSGFVRVKLKVGFTAPRGVDAWLTNVRDGLGVLELEAEMYKALAGGIGIPDVRWFGEECDFYLLVEDLLGPSLEDSFNYWSKRPRPG